MVDLSSANRDMSLLYPRFARLVQLALDDCHAAGYQMEVFEAFRGPERQDYLYAQGRTRPGPIVTKAPAWHSAHILGLAVDVAAKVNGEWSWNYPVDKVRKIFEARGMQSLAPFENSHFQYMNGLDITAAVSMMRASGLQRVWMEVSAAANKAVV